MKKSVLLAISTLIGPCTSIYTMQQPAQHSSLELFTKYIDPEKTSIEYADLHKLRDTFKQQYPENSSILDLQKRLISCCALQELRQVEGHSYVEDRQILQTKFVALFPGKTKDDNYVRSAFLYLFPEKGALNNEKDYCEYLDQLVQDIKKLENKTTGLSFLLKDKEISTRTLEEVLSQKNDIEKQKHCALLNQHKTLKSELELSLPMHKLALKILEKRLIETQEQLKAWIELIEKDVQAMEGDPKSQGTTELTEFKSKLHTAKKVLAYSKGEGSLWNDMFGY